HPFPKISGSVQGSREWLTVAEVGVVLDVSRATAYRLVQERRIGHVRISNAVKVHVEQLREYVRGAIHLGSGDLTRPLTRRNRGPAKPRGQGSGANSSGSGGSDESA